MRDLGQASNKEQVLVQTLKGQGFKVLQATVSVPYYVFGLLGFHG